MELKVLRKDLSVIDAEIIKGLLEDHEIFVVLQDEAVNGVMPHLHIALGGVKVMVPADDFEQAGAILQEAETANQQDGSQSNGTVPESEDTAEELAALAVSKKLRRLRDQTIVGLFLGPGLFHAYALVASLPLVKERSIYSRKQQVSLWCLLAVNLGLVVALAWVLLQFNWDYQGN